MKFMKLGTRPDTFFSTEAIRSVSSEVSNDLRIQVQNILFQLHKFPLLSKCLRLQKLCSELKDNSEQAIIQLPDLPGGAEAFEICAKFCYGITITLSSLNIVPVRCAADHLQMTDEADRGNLVGKLDVFLKSCILRRWKDTLVTLQTTRNYPALSEELGLTGLCVDAIATAIITNHCSNTQRSASTDWWAEDIGELGVDHYWRIMAAVKSSGIIPDKLIGKALQIYACRWLPNYMLQCSESRGEITISQRLLMENIVNLLPAEKGSAPCSFVLKLLKVANLLNASTSLRMELARRVGTQLEEASVNDLLIPAVSGWNDTVYDVDSVMAMLEEFLLQGQSPPTSPPREKLICERRRRRRSRSAENVEFKVQESGRRSSSASHSSKLRVAKLIDGYLQRIAGDKNLPMEKLIAIAEAVPEFARADHDDLYRVIDTFLRAHPDLDKNARKQLCRILDCKKLSVEACMHAAQNELLPLRVVVQVLFFEQSRAAMTSGQVTELPSSIKALLAKATTGDDHIGAATPFEDGWSVSGLKCPTAKLATLKMKLAEDDDDDDIDDYLTPHALLRSASSRFRALCSLPKKPKRIICKLLALNRSASERIKTIAVTSFMQKN